MGALSSQDKTSKNIDFCCTTLQIVMCTLSLFSPTVFFFFQDDDGTIWYVILIIKLFSWNHLLEMSLRIVFIHPLTLHR